MQATDERLVAVTTILAERLAAAMKVATNPLPGVLAVAVSTDAEIQSVSVLKLDATHEAARFRELAEGNLSIQLLRDLLPSP
ncbi:MAG: hypothetical protein M3290_01515, partial [Actinomycetota bacterium]|nr:hypothetical protein [Actinomycetota bacterium]